ncbi:NADH dehydrogenase [ubiquinone] 1 beta subcomplex subunit 10 [Schistocerca americana]|uniref:NADH dehydrogenase [ubiquinone] 1 beta subcomplex subunit 10 n=1 Tax=Schistocerca americana TaxID=7009 RepID=UPI001F4F4332|nr:NADH dehydrogenase [ubiquinone] 1 beta subcomplex subunit 10 [Schistocerca americana]XP_047107885.1 NADH dehydrogenase [ubiquinone] 1 beta subcomplex subunit 10 [Schistocerca piceifrons]XP_049775785.1 NADH dehydrogenase [ubiquinone] 1 beta subcomplex subunit 10 isoform X1 [Schistocerca cancellata]XP_049775786.1 NADH dehydrogenase [ubiquinone] 1 beta subcomplex subunit 10 isoform X2 [Schistocerca cancellata]XP_049775787.1 NADH dehydrogenase [ubiquinone] 1 beta subcomplex subunit 10 isoform X3
MGDNPPGRNPMQRFANAVSSVVEGPVIWFREKVVEPNRPTYYWYHRKMRRVPTIDECYTDDAVCYLEANAQFKRDKMVESEILSILRQRYEDCVHYETPDHVPKCKLLLDQYNKAAENWFIKYGDLGFVGDVRDAFMKQKHRMVWERRHGPVGSGMRETNVPA